MYLYSLYSTTKCYFHYSSSTNALRNILCWEQAFPLHVRSELFSRYPSATDLGNGCNSIEVMAALNIAIHWALSNGFLGTELSPVQFGLFGTLCDCKKCCFDNHMWLHFDLMKPYGVKCQIPWSLLILVMACDLLGVKLILERSLAYCC